MMLQAWCPKDLSQIPASETGFIHGLSEVYQNSPVGKDFNQDFVVPPTYLNHFALTLLINTE